MVSLASGAADENGPKISAEENSDLSLGTAADAKYCLELLNGSQYPLAFYPRLTPRCSVVDT